MVPRPSIFAAMFVLTGLAACDPAPPRAARVEAQGPREAGYLAPPRILKAETVGTTTLLQGLAAPGAQVRLAAPGGEARRALADAKGGFSLDIPLAAGAQVFGLSMVSGGRQVQAEGYVLLTARGQTVMLRSGGAGERLDLPPGRPAIGAFDFDRAGASTISGWAQPNAGLSVRLDGRQALEARSNEDGRYVIALPNLTPGPHRVEVVGDGFTQSLDVTISPPEPLTDSPVRARQIGGGWRIDWLTPGGGLQSTLIVG